MSDLGSVPGRNFCFWPPRVVGRHGPRLPWEVWLSSDAPEAAERLARYAVYAAGRKERLREYARARHRRLKAFHGIYAPAGNTGRCEYCGEPATGVDHVPALAIVDNMSDAERAKCCPVLVECCMRCNTKLKEHGGDTVGERREIIGFYLSLKRLDEE